MKYDHIKGGKTIILSLAAGIMLLTAQAQGFNGQLEADNQEGKNLITAQDDLLAHLTLPVMDNFQEVTDQQVVFDSAEGRIVTAEIQGVGETKRVMAYYYSTLPSLGWVMDKSDQLDCEMGAKACLRAKREDELLMLTLFEGDQLDLSALPDHQAKKNQFELRIKFEVSPLKTQQ